MKITQRTTTHRQQGAVSLFIVIFTSLLLVTITVSFMQLMVKDQQQASNSDLSESAYDSAVAGVEDAKRALLMQQDCIGQNTPHCNTVRSAINSEQCDTLGVIFGSAANGESEIKQSEGDRRMEQAYTCVKVLPNTDDFLGSLNPQASSTLIPLRGESSFNTLVISWGQSQGGGSVDLPSAGSQALPRADRDNWPQNRPALLRAQLINGQGTFSLTDFDASGYSNTLFLHPSRTGLPTTEFVLDGRRPSSPGSELQFADCKTSVASGDYACRVAIDIDPTITAGSQTAFLNLAAFYNATDFKVELYDGDELVRFDGVQPEVDSTGRANDLFRRVVSRIELGNSFNYPVAALETTGNLCKNFSVTTEADDYRNLCTP